MNFADRTDFCQNSSENKFTIKVMSRRFLKRPKIKWFLAIWHCNNRSAILPIGAYFRVMRPKSSFCIRFFTANCSETPTNEPRRAVQQYTPRSEARLFTARFREPLSSLSCISMQHVTHGFFSTSQRFLQFFSEFLFDSCILLDASQVSNNTPI